MAHPGGRPTVMTENVISKLESAFLNGATDLQACFLADISKDTFYRYLQDHPEFSDKVEMLKDDTKIKAKLAIRNAIMSEDKPDTAKWYLERKDKEFKAKTDITSNDNEIQPVLVKFIGDENDRDTTGV